MISSPDTPATEPSSRLIGYFRDAYRSIQGKPPKYSISAVERYRQNRPNYDFTANTISAVEWELLSSLIGESAQYEGPIVEVGVLAGRTTQRIATAKTPEQKILAVDNFCWNGWGFTPDEQWSLVNLSLGFLTATGQVEIHRVDKNEFYETYNGVAPALVFVDAMHDYEETKKDLLWARRIGAKIICGHDYSDEFPGVKQIVDELGGPRLLAGTLFAL